GYVASQAKDQRLASFYTPDGDETDGYLTYKLSKDTELDEVVILQNPEAISNAEVTIRDENGWHEIGQLTDSLNMLDTSSYENVLEVKLEWNSSVKPQIHEIIPVKKQETSVENMNDIKKLVEQLAEDGAFEDEQSVHQLQLHLTA